MARHILSGLVALSLFGLPMVGCDRKVAEDTTVHKNADGTTSKDSKVVKQNSDGTTTTTEEHKKQAP